MYFWDNLDKPFKKIKEELKQNGKLFIYMATSEYLNKHKFTKDDIFNKYTIDYVSQELKRAGMKNINYKFDNGYYITCEK